MLKLNAELRRDPTRTTVLRNAYSRDITRRFRNLKTAMRRGIVDRDALGITNPLSVVLERAPEIPDMPSFVFETSEQKVAKFLQWLRVAEDDGILEVVQRDGRTVTERREWQNIYIQNAYQRGIDQAITTMGSSGIPTGNVTVSMLFAQPIHVDRVGILFTRNFALLEGITETMNSQIGRVLAEGIASGKGAREVARDLADRVDKIGITRAKVLARTEIINAHAEATLNTYEQFGIEGVEVMAEWATAGDERVCERCEAREGMVMTIDEARGLIPFHPNCRCAWIPIEAGENAGERRRRAA